MANIRLPAAHSAVYAATGLISGNQVFGAVNTPEPLIIDTILGSSGVNPNVNGSFEMLRSGVFNFTTFPNLYKTSGGQAQFDIWYQIDKGSGWVDEPNSASRYTMLSNTNNTDQVIDFPYRGLILSAGWKIRFMAQVDDIAVVLTTVPATGVRPLIPANFINVEWLGG